MLSNKYGALMSDVDFDAVPSLLLKYNLTDKFTVQRASEKDLPEILAIYAVLNNH